MSALWQYYTTNRGVVGIPMGDMINSRQVKKLFNIGRL